MAPSESRDPSAKDLRDTDTDSSGVKAEAEAVDALDFGAGKVDGSSIGFEELTLDVLMVRYSYETSLFR